MRAVPVAPAVLALLLLGNTPALPQQARVVATDELSAAVVEHADATQKERQRLQALLEHPEVRDVARSHGIDIERIETGAATLSGAALMRLAPHVRTVETRLKQDRITVTATTLILILLLVILIVLIT